MVIEILYPDLCCLFGDRGNYTYLQQCLKKAKFIFTNTNDVPYFVKHKVDFIYMGSSSEESQQAMVQMLSPYVKKLNKLITEGTAFLLTGNAMEVFGKEVIDVDGSKLYGLGLLDIYAKRDRLHRINDVFLGEYLGLDILGFQSQFTTCTTTEEKIITKKLGIGLNYDEFGGIRKNNLIATYLIGPLLIMNPLLTKKLFRIDKLAFEQTIMDAYNQRLQELQRLAIK